jgi:hypothetical protein
MATDSLVTLVTPEFTVVELEPEGGEKPKRGAATGEV